MKKIVIIGECMIELNGEPFGKMWQAYGGDTLNTATYLARLSRRSELDVCYLSAMGNDNLSSAMIEKWQQDGINTDWVLRDPTRQAGLYLIQLDKQGERTFLYWRNQSAARYLLQHPDYPTILEQLSSADMIYLSGISLAILPEQDRALLIQQLISLARQGVEIAFDSNFRPHLWQSLEAARQCYSTLLPHIHLALMTFDDEQLLWQDRNPQQAIQRLKQTGVKNIIIKIGAEGALIAQANQQIVRVETKPITNVVDTTAAGDAFNAGFLNGYLQGKPLTRCCEQGNQLAGVVIQHKGAIIPKTATEHLLEEFNFNLL